VPIEVEVAVPLPDQVHDDAEVRWRVGRRPLLGTDGAHEHEEHHGGAEHFLEHLSLLTFPTLAAGSRRRYS